MLIKAIQESHSLLQKEIEYREKLARKVQEGESFLKEQQQMIDDLQRQLDEVKSKQPQSP